MKENQTEHPSTFPRSSDQGMVNRILLEKRSSRSCTAVRYPEKVLKQPKGDKSGTFETAELRNRMAGGVGGGG